MNPTCPGIYAIRNTLNNKVYVGKSTNMWKRWRHHRADLRNGAHSNPYLQHGWDKYGETAFAFNVVEMVQDPVLLSSREGYYCALFQAQDSQMGYNLAGVDTEDHPVLASAELRQKRSMNRLGRVDSEETRHRKSEGRKGIPMSEATKAKISAIRLGMKPSAETRQKMSDARRGRSLSPETVAKLRAAHAGRRFPEWATQKAAELKRGKPGRPHTEETKLKIGAAHRGKVLSEETKRRMSVTKRARFAAARMGS